MVQWNELRRILAGWLRWFRFSRAVHWGLRGLAISLGAVFLIGLIFVPWHIMDAFDFIAWVFWGSQIGLWAGFIIGFVWPINHTGMVHSFDRLFGLQERVSTAIEVQNIVVKNLPGKDILVKGWRERQLADTVMSARKIKPNAIKPFKWERKVIAFVYAIGIILAIFWIIAQPQFDLTDRQRSTTQYLKTEIELIQTKINEINAAQNLTQTQKDTLTAPYTDAKNKLQKASSPEQAIKILSQAQQKFYALTVSASETQMLAYQNLGQIIGKTNQSPLKAVGTALSNRDFVNAAQLLQNLQIKNLSPQQKQTLVNEFSSASEQIKFNQTALSQKMSDTVSSLENGNIDSSQSALKEVANLIGTMGNQTASAELAQNAAKDLENRKQVLQAQSEKKTQTSQNANAISSTPNASQNKTGINLDNSSYESVYSPQSGESAAANTEQSGGTNSSQVPYVEIISSYSGTNEQKIQNGSVPGYLVPLVQDYFNSLTP